MEKNLMQLFFRETAEEGVYLVCGLVKTSAPITPESQYLIPFEAWHTIPLRNIASISEGKGLDQLITEKTWASNRKEMTTMKHYYFCETFTDEEFLVGAYSYEEASKIAEEVARNMSETWHTGYWGLEYHGTMSEIEAECSGLDEY